MKTRDKVTATEAARLLGRSEKTVRQWLKRGRFPGARIARLNGLRQWVIPMADIQAIQAQEAEDRPGSIPELEVRLAELERRVTDLETARRPVVADIERKSYEPIPETLRRISRPLLSTAPSNLPAGYIPLADFYHNIPRPTLNRYIKQGIIAIRRGSWSRAGHLVEKALDAEQQALFYERVHNHPAFIPCPKCPHTLLASENQI